MFQNREQAGELLAQKLLEYKKRADGIVLGIPRGGVVVAAIVAKALHLPLDIVVVKKIGAPQNLELAIGAVGPKGVAFWDEDLCQRLDVSITQKAKLKSQKLKEREEREKMLRVGRTPLDLKEKTAILVDDGVATGATVLASSLFLKKEQARKAILAVPVIAKDTLSKVKDYFFEVLYLDAPIEFYAVGQFYKEFPQVSDEKVVKILRN